MKRFTVPLIATVILLFAAAYGTFVHIPKQNPDPNHTHADFAVWIDGKQWNFSAPQYMTLEEGQTSSGSHPHDPYFHLHDGNGHVIHRHKPGLPLSRFFESLGFQVKPGCLVLDTGVPVCDNAKSLTEKWRMTVNGTERPFDLSYVFVDDDHILLTYGADDAEVQHEQSILTDDACTYSQTCPWKGPPPTENCIADPTVPCVGS